jgi:hypothetical protein
LAEDGVDGQNSRETEPEPPSTGRMTIALMATALVATGVLVFALALVLIVKLAPLAIHARKASTSARSRAT